ncbi:hypothetical protein [Rhizobium sp. SYY.PMSO]|uniref:hypothetical protein n=1 Tax=Rhizobium sp. SYY.PMSO TaxID=3382192 RepID=UPI00398F978A
MNRIRHFLPAIVLAGKVGSYASVVWAQTAPAKPIGLWLTTDFPVLTDHIGEDTSLPLGSGKHALPNAPHQGISQARRVSNVRLAIA